MGSGRDKRKKSKVKTPGQGEQKTARKTEKNEGKAERRAAKKIEVRLRYILHQCLCLSADKAVVYMSIAGH